jgi:hypothetical protein
MIVIIDNDIVKNTDKFTLTCNKCGSRNVEISIDWASYPSCSWHTTQLICKDCHEDEVIQES